VELLSPIVTLFLVMDPLGNVPLFLSVLRAVDPARRRAVLVREIAIAFGVLTAFLLVGGYVMRFLNLEQPAIGIAGGIVLFLIALRMVFPSDAALRGATVDGNAARHGRRSDAIERLTVIPGAVSRSHAFTARAMHAADETWLLREAIHQYFKARAAGSRRRLRELFRRGRHRAHRDRP